MFLFTVSQQRWQEQKRLPAVHAPLFPVNSWCGCAALAQAYRSIGLSAASLHCSAPDPGANRGRPPEGLGNVFEKEIFREKCLLANRYTDFMFK